MKCTKYFFVIVLSTFIYVLLSVAVGQNSLYCYKQLEEEKRKVSVQTSEIENINTELKLEYSALLNDKAVIAAYARKLDYVSPDEKIVKINGLKPAQTTLYNSGTVLKHEKPVYLTESACKIMACCSGFLLLLIFLLIDVSKGKFKMNSTKPKSVKEIPVYDLPQI